MPGMATINVYYSTAWTYTLKLNQTHTAIDYIYMIKRTIFIYPTWIRGMSASLLKGEICNNPRRIIQPWILHILRFYSACTYMISSNILDVYSSWFFFSQWIPCGVSSLWSLFFNVKSLRKIKSSLLLIKYKVIIMHDTPHGIPRLYMLESLHPFYLWITCNATLNISDGEWQSNHFHNIYLEKC